MCPGGPPLVYTAVPLRSNMKVLHFISSYLLILSPVEVFSVVQWSLSPGLCLLLVSVSWSPSPPGLCLLLVSVSSWSLSPPGLCLLVDGLCLLLVSVSWSLSPGVCLLLVSCLLVSVSWSLSPGLGLLLVSVSSWSLSPGWWSGWWCQRNHDRARGSGAAAGGGPRPACSMGREA